MRHLDDLMAMSRKALASALDFSRKNDCAPNAIDATAGNGRDTLFLAAALKGIGRVWAFDVQESALASARKRFAEEAPELLDSVSFILSGHEKVAAKTPESIRGRVWAATFNLGYLPGSDKKIVTQAETTSLALTAISSMMPAGGVLSAHCYEGHAGGESETAAVDAWFAALPWSVWRVAGYSFVNKERNRETLFLAERICL